MDEKYNKRYHYIDNIKIAACILVVTGHFWGSMVNNSILPKNVFYNYIVYGMYTFHVELFFVCSGFLYQKANKVHSLKSRGENVKWKFINLGVPYFVFTGITIVLKHMAEDSVTRKIGGTLDTLFVHPTAPYWYLYVLFFMFLLIPCMRSINQAGILLGASVLINVVYNVISPEHFPQLLRYICDWQVYFAIGILLAFIDEKALKKPALTVCIITGIAALILNYYYVTHGYKKYILQILSILFTAFCVFAAIRFCPKKLSKISYRLSDYFMPVYVLHTIFAAALRIGLVKLGIQNVVIHIIAGFIGSFILPVITYEICKKTKILVFFFYPQRVIKQFREKKGNI